nr:MAG TPA: hypothetical protein [Caudoviricetes sp.]
MPSISYHLYALPFLRYSNSHQLFAFPSLRCSMLFRFIASLFNSLSFRVCSC